MIAVISPAKTLDYQRPFPPFHTTHPRFEADATRIARAAARLSKKRLAELMHISDSLAELNVERFRNFDALPQRAALYAFAGDVYTGFEAATLDPPAILFAQDHLRMLSGLYGLLRPLDEIRPYRLEMGTPWAPARGDLYAYWGARIGALLAQDLAETGGDTIVNLASKEYWRAAEAGLPADAHVVTIDFREDGPQGLRFNTFSGKRARGMMARFICEHRLADVDALKGFDSDGYRYVAEGSTNGVWRFVRG